jgi:hypothetical protein
VNKKLKSMQQKVNLEDIFTGKLRKPEKQPIKPSTIKKSQAKEQYNSTTKHKIFLIS